jgi:hypothetical protein
VTANLGSGHSLGILGYGNWKRNGYADTVTNRINYRASKEFYACSGSAFTTKTTGELQILGLDGNTLGMDGGQIGIFEEGDEISLSSFLEGHNSRGLEAEIGLVV